MKTNISLEKIALQYRNSILVPTLLSKSESCDNRGLSMMFQAELMRLGYIMERQLFESISTLPVTEINVLYYEVIPTLWQAKGADKKWRVFYPDFPKQVLKASDEVLFWNAMNHYWSFGLWTPCYKVSKRIPKLEDVKLTELKVADSEDVMSVFTELLGSNVSLSEASVADLDWFLDTYGNKLGRYMPESIPFKEQLCRFAAYSLSNKLNIGDKALQTATDVLRVMTHLSGGDISLAENTKFRSWKRSERKFFAQTLERVINGDDIARHGAKWKRAFHGLHIGDYCKIAPKTYAIADQLRNGKIVTYLSRLEAAIKLADAEVLANLLGARPGEFARRLDHLLRILPEGDAINVIKLFGEVAEKVDARVLIQLYGHIKGRNQNIEKRVVMPKGSQAKARVLKKSLVALPDHMVDSVKQSITQALVKKFSKQSELGKVWIAPELMRCPVPLAQRSASDSLHTVARGTRLPITDKNTLRMFIWWKGQDVDLSCVLYDVDLKAKGQISYTNLRLPNINSCHSGDITYAPKGAAEFIDIDMEQALKAGVRYIAMNVLDFTGKQFANYEECFAGWMTRDYPNSNDIFDPKTVEQKVDLRSSTTLAAPVVFDLDTREAIWLDLSARGSKSKPNNVESNAASLKDLLESTLLLSNKTNLYELFDFHAKARGQRVFSRDEAETIFSLDEGLTPFDISKIGAEYI